MIKAWNKVAFSWMKRGKAMKIAIFTDTFVPDVNGVAKTLNRYTKFLMENGIEYRVFAPKTTGDNRYSEKIHAFRSLPFLLYPECRVALPNMVYIKEELQNFQPDIIHVATPFNMGLCGIHYAKKLNIPLVGSYHTDFDKYLEYYNLEFLSSLLWKYVNWFHRPLQRIFVPSKDTKERLERHGFTNLAIWPRGIDEHIFHRNYDRASVRRKYKIKEKYILLYAGRIASEKDVMLLPEIAKQLDGDIRWVITGDGPLKEELEKSAPDQMTFTGFLEGGELAELYAAADLFVFPSASETFGNVVLESLACGTPVIGADAGGVRTIIQHGKTGFLCEEKAVSQFVSAIDRLLEDEEMRHAMGKAGFRYAQGQSWDTIFNHLIADYDEVLAGDSWKSKVLA